MLSVIVKCIRGQETFNTRNEALEENLRFFERENSVVEGKIFQKSGVNVLYSNINGNFHPNFAIIGQNVIGRIHIEIS